MEPAPHTVDLDEHLRDVVTALHRAVSYAVPHHNDPEVADKAIRDCREILGVVMKGEVSEWIE